jgi:hypothetical protein
LDRAGGCFACTLQDATQPFGFYTVLINADLGASHSGLTQGESNIPRILSQEAALILVNLVFAQGK